MSGLGPGGAELFNYRTVYMGNLPSGVTLEEVLNHVRGGTVEQAKIIEEKNCAFISFVDSTSAFAFAQEHGLGNPSERSRGNSLIVIGENQIRVGWGKPSRVANTIAESIQKGATRNVFIGNVDESVTEQMLTTEFSQFGPIDRVKIVPGKNIAFVHMASISAAVQAVDALSKDPKFEGKRLNYGKDRCNVVNQAGAAPPTEMIQPYPAQMVLNRTVYIGGVHPEATLKDLCDAVRGGMVQSVKLLSDKNVAFVTFVDPVAAVNFIQRGSLEGVAVKGKRVRVAWGKPTPPMPLQVAAAIQRENATRTLYIVNPMVETLLSEQKLRTDLADFGEIEMVNVLPQKGIGFVSFGDVASAIRAVDSANTGTGLKSVSPDYANCKVSYGKDRCAQPPRPRMFAGDDAWGQAGNSMQMGMVGMGAMNMGGMGMMPGMSMGGMNMGMGGGMGSGTMSAMAMGMSGMNSNGMGVGGGMGMGMGGGGVSSGSYRSAGGSSGSRTGNFTRRVSTSGTASTGSSAVVLVGSGAGDGSS
ncbi:hypothetical protein DFJ73DRAFT_621230 [Zopfochytrium polystomum]|nr:hypothetical protein DFJ73DRAFT_621230 [Zopfochytrium polystomum]